MNTNLITEEQHRNREAGIAYVVLLIYLTIMTCLGLSFIQKVGLEAKIVMNKTISSQAHSLARSAASHAMWGMLNVPGFAPDGSMYYMHSLANGRYGYKVRKPTETTFATIAAIGVMGESVVEQGYVPYIIPSNVYTAYGSTSSGIPLYRRLIGADWNAPNDVLLGGGNGPRWVELEGCPVRNELIAGAIDGIGEIKVAVYDGTTWGNAEPFGHGDQNYKCFDIAYESQSGDALVVSRDGTATPLYYDIWDGTGWVYGNPQTAINLPGGDIHDVVMASQPGGDEILIAVVTSWGDIQLVRWDGSAFSDLGTIETVTARNDFRVVEIVYEHQSGDAMVVWSRSSDSALKFRMWNGVALGPEGDLPDFGGNANYVIRGAADSDPTSDYIVIGAVDNFYDLSVAIWDGDNWIDSREIEIATSTNTCQVFDVAWEAAGEDVVIAWAPWNVSNVRSMAWKKGTALADCTIEDGPVLPDGWLVRLLPISGTEKIVLLGEDQYSDLRYCLWAGDNFKGDPAILLEPNVPVQNDVAFDLAEANVPRTGGTGSGGGGNLPPTVEAGPDQTVCLLSDATLDGTVTDDGLPDPPNTVTTTWSKVSGPGTVTFGDSLQVDTVATFSEAGEYVLRLRANDSEFDAFDEVTIIVASPCSLLFVVGDPSNLTSGDIGRKGLFESWCYAVTLINDGDTQSNIDAAIAANDVVYAGSSAQGPSMLDKFNNSNKGVVNEVYGKLDNFGFCSSTSGTVSADTVSIVDDTHYITSEFAIGLISVFNSTLTMRVTGGTLAPDLQNLAEAPSSPGQPAVVSLESGAQLYGGGNAPERRVHLPYYNADLSDLTPNAQTIMKRAVDWAAHKEGGCGGVGGSCNADYTPDTKKGEFSTAAYGSGDTQSITYLPVGMTFNSVTAPAGGAWISCDPTDDLFYMTDVNGNLLTSVATATASTRGVTLVTFGTFANHLATVDNASNNLTYVDMDGNPVAQLSLGGHGIGQVAGVGFIETTMSGTYDGHIAVADRTTESVYVITQTNVLKTTIDVNDGTLDALQDVGHLPGTDKIIIPYLHEVRIYDLNGSLVRQYDTTTFGMGDLESVIINPTNCDHVVADKGLDMVMYLNISGGGGSDTDPPTPDPMTWATPPAPAGPTSITMTATTATDPSGVMYYFECTAGGGNDSGWIDTPTYVDTGLTPNTSYTYRVKATDKASPPNETGWSTEESATTDTVPEMYVNDIAMGFRQQGPKYFGQATVWIKDDGGADVSGALVTGDWSGAVSEMAMGTTGGDGKIFFESGWVNGGGTYTFTVTDVTKSGYVYNPALNVETSDSITVP